MKQNNSLRRMCAAALLIAAGIVIPMFMPVKIVLEPASFTLGSHVAIFLAMFISPAVAALVAVGTTIGFVFGGFPPAVILRAATHLIFALLGSAYLEKHPSIFSMNVRLRGFSFVVGVIHAFCEVVAVGLLYFSGQMGAGYYQTGFVRSVLLLVGLGTIVHSMVDFELALAVYRVLRKQRNLAGVFGDTSE